MQRQGRRSLRNGTYQAVQMIIQACERRHGNATSVRYATMGGPVSSLQTFSRCCLVYNL